MADIPPQLQALPPAEAIAFFRGKGLQEGFAWQDVWKQEHARAFTVAKAMRRDVLQDVYDAVERALVEGRTFDQFRGELEPLLKEKGWWGKAPMTDPLDGETRTVQLGSTRRLRTIFDVNLRSAYAAGRWQRIEETKTALPFLRYVAVQDSRTRPEHAEWHGTVLPVDDPWWDTHYPPCGFNCRCTTVQITQRTMDRRGWEVTQAPTRFPPQPYVNPRTGEAVVLERGIDPGFDYNVGKAWLDGVTPRASGEPPAGPSTLAAKVPQAAGATALTARPGPTLQALDLGEATAAFVGRLGIAPGDSSLFTDAGGDPFPVGPALFTSGSGAPRRFSAAQLAALPMAAEAIADPDEIRWVWSSVSRAQLVRRYIRRISQGEAAAIDVLVDVVAGGAGPWWTFRTAFDRNLSLDVFRVGVVAWRREATAD